MSEEYFYTVPFQQDVDHEHDGYIVSAETKERAVEIAQDVGRLPKLATSKVHRSTADELANSVLNLNWDAASYDIQPYHDGIQLGFQ